MTVRLILLCAAATRAAREGRFPDPADRIDDDVMVAVPVADRYVIAPTMAARETAAALGLGCTGHDALADGDAGAWAGQALRDLDADALATWLSAPENGPPGGESMAAVLRRVTAWMATLHDGATLAITHPAVIRAAIAHALDVPVSAAMAIDVAPLSLTYLSRHTRWRLQELRRA